MCLFMSMIFILIEIKFDIDINNDELLITIWEIIRRKFVTSSAQQCGAQVYIYIYIFINSLNFAFEDLKVLCTKVGGVGWLLYGVSSNGPILVPPNNKWKVQGLGFRVCTRHYTQCDCNKVCVKLQNCCEKCPKNSPFIAYLIISLFMVFMVI